MYRRGSWVHSVNLRPCEQLRVETPDVTSNPGRLEATTQTRHTKLTTTTTTQQYSNTPLPHRPPAAPPTPLSAMAPQTYYLVSLPASISASGEPSEALTTLRSAVSTDNGTTYPFNVPHFKIGTLDALVQQADELARLEGGCKGVVDKVADSLRGLLEGDEDKIQEQKVVNDRECGE